MSKASSTCLTQSNILDVTNSCNQVSCLANATSCLNSCFPSPTMGVYSKIPRSSYSSPLLSSSNLTFIPPSSLQGAMFTRG